MKRARVVTSLRFSRPGLRVAGVGLLLLLLASCVIVDTYLPTNSWANSPQIGFHTHRGDSLHLEAAQTAGASFVVVVFSWRDIEPVEGHLYWETPDAVLRTADYYGLDVVARLDRPPDWAIADGGVVPWRIDAYGNFARHVAERYGNRLAGVIAWNEPNLSLEWNDSPPDPIGYTQLLRAAYSAIKDVSPGLPVLLAGLAFSEGDGLNAVNDLHYLEALYENGAGDYFDVLASHPYGFGRPPEEEPAPYKLNFRRLELHRVIMERYGDKAKPVWITEMGWRTSAPQEADAWQTVSEDQQAAYTLRALQFAKIHYPWLERMAFWELNADQELYGYAFWQGPRRTSEAYRLLVEEHLRTGDGQRRQIPSEAPLGDDPQPIEVLAPDVTVRLGDLGILHPHWVHLRGDDEARLDWSAEFFLIPAQVLPAYDLLLELMQIDQATNLLYVNGHELGRVEPRSRPDPTSTWVTQRFRLPSDLLQPGPNHLSIRAGVRSPVRQYQWWRRENMQVRHVRLVPVSESALESDIRWHRMESPGSWGEVHRLRLFSATENTSDLWVAANRRSQLWRMSLLADGQIDVVFDEAGGADLVFFDVAVTQTGIVAATDRGLYVRGDHTDRWRSVAGTPLTQAYSAVVHGGHVYAGFETGGMWRASMTGGSWQPTGLAERSVLDLASAPRALYAATDRGVYALEDNDWRRLPDLPEAAYSSAHGRPGGEFITRLFVGSGGELVVRNQDRLWLFGADQRWVRYGPDAHQGRIFSLFNCCVPGSAMIATNQRGLWRQSVTGEWARVDGDVFSDVELTGGALVGDTIYVASHNGLFASHSGEDWRPVGGLAPTVTDLLLTGSGSVWVAGTPSGVWRSLDSGRAWEPVSAPWVVWDLAYGVDGRLYVARADGVAYTDSSSSKTVSWRESQGLESVTFFSVNPSPTIEASLWAGTWGNNIGVSDDGGESMAPLHNGLETLSVLDILWHNSPRQVSVATIAGLYRTDDGGETWFKLPGELMEQTVFALYQTENGTILAGAADGLWASIDYGVTWMRVPGMPVMTVLKIGRIEVAGASWLWAGTEGSGLWLSTDDGRSWRYGGLEGHTVYAVHKASEGNLIAATDGGLLEWAIRDSSDDLSRRQGQAQDMVRSSSMGSQDTESHEGDAVHAEAGHENPEKGLNR